MSFRWGIFGTGAISAKFVAGLAAAPGHTVALVASREQASAERFAAAIGAPRAIGGYAEAARAAREAGVDAIYIATPLGAHAEHALACIAAGVPVLIEKPITATAAEARAIAEAARAAGVFAMEAMWTRFLPATQALRDRVAAGAIGEPRIVSGSFGTSKVPDRADSAFDPARAGGATGMAYYPIALAQWLFGAPETITAIGRGGECGVEEDVAITLSFAGGVVGSFHGSIRAWAPNDFHVLGTHGAIAFRGPVFRPSGYALSQQQPRRPAPARFDWKSRVRETGFAQRLAQLTELSSRSQAKAHRVPYAGNGYHYEALEVAACLGRGDRESAIMPLADSIAIGETLDIVRAAATGSTENPS